MFSHEYHITTKNNHSQFTIYKLPKISFIKTPACILSAEKAKSHTIHQKPHSCHFFHCAQQSRAAAFFICREKATAAAAAFSIKEAAGGTVRRVMTSQSRSYGLEPAQFRQLKERFMIKVAAVTLCASQQQQCCCCEIVEKQSSGVPEDMENNVVPNISVQVKLIDYSPLILGGKLAYDLLCLLLSSEAHCGLLWVFK